MLRQQLRFSLGEEVEDTRTWDSMPSEVQREVTEGYGRLLVAVLKSAKRKEGGDGDDRGHDDE